MITPTTVKYLTLGTLASASLLLAATAFAVNPPAPYNPNHPRATGVDYLSHLLR